MRNKFFHLILNLCLGASFLCRADVTLNNGQCIVSVSEYGGAITSLQLADYPLNPLSWALEVEEMPENNRKGAPFRGHFICLGRWGIPSKGEKRLGMPNNGDVAALAWTIQDSSSGHIRMTCVSELDLMETDREISLDPHSPLYLIKDRVINTATIGRLFNIVQHATLGTPFLSDKTLINTNAGKGFMQDNHLPSPEAKAYSWPYGILADGCKTVDLRLSNGEESYVSSHVLADSIGWATAISPPDSLLIGYVWKTSDYPWLNVWHQTIDGAPWAKGLEFGTTGLGAPYDELLELKSDFFGNKSFFFFDAGEEIEKKFASFILRIPEDFGNAETIDMRGEKLVIGSTTGKTIEIESKLLNEL